MSAGTVSASINAGPIHITGHSSPEAGIQLRMGYDLFIHIDGPTAKQWISELEKIASTTPKSPESSGSSIE